MTNLTPSHCPDCGRELTRPGAASCDEQLALMAGPETTDPIPFGYARARFGSHWLAVPPEHVDTIRRLNPPCATLRSAEESERRAALPAADAAELERLHAEQIAEAQAANPGGRVLDLGPGFGYLWIPVVEDPATARPVASLQQLAEALDIAGGCYGSEDKPAQRFESLAELDHYMNVQGYAFDSLNEVIGCRVFEADDDAVRSVLYVTIALPRKNRIVDWTCPVGPEQLPELLAFLGRCRRRALDRTALLWPDLSLNDQ